MKINKDDKVIDALYEENKMLRDEIKHQKETLSSYLEDIINKDYDYKFKYNKSYIKGLKFGCRIIKEFCEKNLWNS